MTATILAQQIERELKEVSRSTEIAEARALMKELQEAKLANDRLLSVLYAGLETIIRLVVQHAELIHPDAGDARSALDFAFKTGKERADMLIFSTVMFHAASQPDATKAFLSGDRGFSDSILQPHLDGAGLKVFRSTEAVLGWARSQPRDVPT